MSTAPYLNRELTIEERCSNLLGRMTLEEKVGQIMMWDCRAEDLSFIAEKQPGSVLHILGERLDQAMSLAAGTRLGIPLLVGEDCIHGHSFWRGATIFPTQLGLACSWNPELLEQVARITAREAAPTGIHWTFSPVLCIARDLRWGRVGETFGEDPHLIGELASSMIRGYQGTGLEDPDSLLATAKHFAGYSETQGGRDASEADLSRRKLRSFFLPPFEKAARAGALAFMTGYQAIDGVPSTMNHWLLTEVLRNEWGFKGVLVTDWDNVGRLVYEQQVCADYTQAAVAAVRAGNDLMMVTPRFFEGALEAVRSGLLREEEIDAPCARLLALKFRMGLFENPRRPDLRRAELVIRTPEHKRLNLEAARQSLVLLRNEGILPLDTNRPQRIAVVGPNADDDLAQLGDWSLGSSQHPASAGKHPRADTHTVLDGLSVLAPKDFVVRHAKGCRISETGTEGIAAAVELARDSDITVAVIGDNLDYIGETLSTATLELQGAQNSLLEALEATGKPLVVVLIASKPLVLPAPALRASALVCCFNPGMEGGKAVAEAIYGVLNPSGKLPISWPRHVGQQPIYYNQIRGQHGNRYADITQDPLFPFGHGLSYTSYSYDKLEVHTPQTKVGEAVEFGFEVRNTGTRPGDEIVQVYLRDLVTSVTWVDRSLKDFARISLQPGETKTLRFRLGTEAFSLVNAEGQSVIEPGEFELLVGPSSRRDLLLSTRITLL